MGEVPDLQLMITAFTEKVTDVAHAAVVSSDGLPLACSRGFPPDLADQLAAITSGLCSLVQGAARIFEEGVVQTVVVMDRSLLIVRAVTASTVLTVLAAADCDIGQVAYEMALIGEQASHILGPAVRGGPRWPG